jgi:hypothetical protein
VTSDHPHLIHRSAGIDPIIEPFIGLGAPASMSLLDGPSANLMRNPRLRPMDHTTNNGDSVSSSSSVTPPRLPAQRFRSPPPSIGATNGQLSSVQPFHGSATASFAAGFRQPQLQATFSAMQQPLPGALTAANAAAAVARSVTHPLTPSLIGPFQFI